MPSGVDYKIMALKKIKKEDLLSIIKKAKELIISNKVSILFAVFCIFLTCFMSIYLSRVEKPQIVPVKPYDGKTFVTENYPIFKEVVFIGDSYTHRLAEELGYDTTIYSSPGLKVSELTYCFESAKKNQKKYVVVFIGPNDFKGNTKLDEFYNQIKAYTDMFTEESKVILCSYLKSAFSKELDDNKLTLYHIEDYDSELKKVAENAENVFYLDLNEYSNVEEYTRYSYDKNDMLHYNHTFYVEFINRLYDFLVSIK